MDPISQEDYKADQGEMLQTVPRVPMAGVKRRWGGRLGSLQESSPEVSSTGVLSPPPHFHPATPDNTIRTEDLQLWDLDLQRGLQAHPNGNHQTSMATTTILPTTDSTSPCPTTIEGTMLDLLLLLQLSLIGSDFFLRMFLAVLIFRFSFFFFFEGRESGCCAIFLDSLVIL